MALADLSAFRTALQTGIAEAFTATTASLAAGRPSSFYRLAIAPGQTTVPAIPSTPVALDNTDLGGLNRLIPSQSPSNVYAVGYRTFSGALDTTFWLIDRLCHMGGLSGIVTTPQTVNSAALPRYTTGVGVYAAVDVYTAIGSTITTITMEYTNSDGVGSRVSPAVTFGGTGYGGGTGGAPRFLIMPLQDGDKGVLSVQSVTVAATTGTAGNFGVTLFKMLGVVSAPAEQDTPLNILSGGVINIAQIEPTACISLLGASSTASAASGLNGAIQWGTD